MFATRYFPGAFFPSRYFEKGSKIIIVPNEPGLEFTLPTNRLQYTLPDNLMGYTLPANRLHYTLPSDQ